MDDIVSEWEKSRKDDRVAIELTKKVAEKFGFNIDDYNGCLIEHFFEAVVLTLCIENDRLKGKIVKEGAGKIDVGDGVVFLNKDISFDS